MGWLIIGIIILYGWVEFEALFFVGDVVGGLASFLGIFVTALIGLSLLRSQGNAVMHTMRTQMAQGQTGLSQMADSLSLVLGAVLMLLPGYVTDFMGILCFIPGIRSIIGTFLMKHLAGRLIKAAANPYGRGFGTNGFSSMHFQFKDRAPSDDTASGFTGSGFANSDFRGQQQGRVIEDDLIEGEFSEKPTHNPEDFDKDK